MQSINLPNMPPWPSVPQPTSTPVQAGLNGPVFNVLGYGQGLGFFDNNGISDATDAIFRATAACVKARKGTIYFPFATQGSYFLSRQWVIALNDLGAGESGDIAIVCEPGVSIYPTAALSNTECITVSTRSTAAELTSSVRFDKLKLDGIATVGATTGMVCGPDTPEGAGIVIRDSIITRFTGAGSFGLDVRNTVAPLFENCQFSRNYNNCRISGNNPPGLPTTVNFRNCVFYNAGNRDVVVNGGFKIRFDTCQLESSQAESVYVVPTAGKNTVGLEFDNCWIENANRSVGTYAIFCDGSAGVTISVSLSNMYMGNTAPANRCVYLKNVATFNCENIFTPNLPNQIFVDVGCIGTFSNWPENNSPFNTVVNYAASPTSVVNIGPAWANKVNVDTNGNLVPGATQTYDFGSTNFRFRNMRMRTMISWMQQPTYGANVTPDALGGNIVQVVVTDANPFNFLAPTNGEWGEIMVFEIWNNTAGAIGAVTFAGNIKQNGFVAPAIGKRKAALFRFDLTNWSQITAWGPDV